MSLNQVIQEDSFCSIFCIRELLKKTHFCGEPSLGQKAGCSSTGRRRVPCANRQLPPGSSVEAVTLHKRVS